MSEDEDSVGPSSKRSRLESEDDEHSHSEPAQKRPMYDRSRVMSMDNDSRSQQEAIEAMLNLSKSATTHSAGPSHCTQPYISSTYPTFRRNFNSNA